MATTALTAMLAASAAYAQQSGSTADSSNAAGTGAIETVVVTVERREQSLQDVDASVEAISGDRLKDADVSGIDRLQQIAPGLRIGRSGSDPRPAMRGTFTSAIQGNNDPRFGFYVDEVYQSRTSQLSMPFVDLERVEVQKGPQGTLYGRNSFGGNIALTTATPKDDFDAGGEAIYGNYSRVMLDGYVNTPVSSDIDVRFAGQFEDRGGYINNIYNPLAGADNKKQYYLRGSLKWVPHGWDDKLEVLLHASYWNEDDKGNGAFGSKTIGSLYDPNSQVAPGGTLSLPGGATVNLPGGYIGLNALSSTLIPYYIFYRDGVPDINGADVGIPIPGPYTLRTDYSPKQVIKNAEVSFDVNYDLNEWARLRSITAYTYFNAFRTRDADGTSAPKGIGYFLTQDKAFSQEFQVQSTSKGPLQYTFGIYYLHDEVPDGYIGEENRNYTTLGAVASGQYAIYFNNYTYSPLVNYAAPLTSNITSNLITAARSDSINPLTFLTTDSGAVYGQVSYDLTDQLTLTGGIRYTEDHKKFASALQQAAVGGTLAFSPAYGVAPSLAFNHTCNGYTAGNSVSTATNVAQALQTACGERTFSFPTFRAAIDYKLTPENLLYASFNTGKHSGGFSYSPRPGATTLNPVDTENVQAFEIGSKNRFFDDRVQVNADAYYNQYNSLQISVSYPNPLLPGSTSTYSQNGQSNVTPGFDLEILANVMRDWNVNLAVNYMHARDNPVVVSGASSNNLCSIGTSTACPAIGIGLGGAILPNPVSNPSLFQLVPGTTATYNTLGFNQKARVQNQPDITFNVGSTYDFDLEQGGVVRAEWQTYFNGGYLLILNTPNYMQGSFTKTDLRLNYLWPDSHTTMQAFVENIENNAVVDRVTFSNYTYDGNYEAPRTYGIRLAYKY